MIVDALDQIPVDDTTRPAEDLVATVRRQLERHVRHENARDALRRACQQAQEGQGTAGK